MKIDFTNPKEYNTLAEDQLEEFVEFVDWSMVPYRLLTEDIRKKFKDIQKLQARIWFEELLNSLEIKIDEEKYPGHIFFFMQDEWHMDLNEETENLWCSDGKIWSVFESKIGRNYNKIQLFIKNIIESCFTNIKATPFREQDHFYVEVKRHFKKNKSKKCRIRI